MAPLGSACQATIKRSVINYQVVCLGISGERSVAGALEAGWR